MSRQRWRSAPPCPDWTRRLRASAVRVPGSRTGSCPNVKAKGGVMDIRAPEQQYNPYRVFPREQWARLRDGAPMTLEAGEIAKLRSMHDRLDLREVEEIYLPLSRLLSIYIDAMQRLYFAQRRFLGIQDRKMPY